MSGPVAFEVETTIPTEYGVFRFRAYRDTATGVEHLAIVSGEPGPEAVVRVHSECLTGETFGSRKCECGPQLHAALRLVAEKGGIVLYLRGQEGRGIGLIDKLRAYALQERGYDTVDANLALGLPADAREYTAAAAMLRELGVQRVRLLTNNPAKSEALTALGIRVVERLPLVVGRGRHNAGYLDTKAARMGHLLAGPDEPTEHRRPPGGEAGTEAPRTGAPRPGRAPCRNEADER